MAWTELEFPFGSVLTSAKMTQLYTNFSALAEGEQDAPKIKPISLKTGTQINTFTSLGQGTILNSSYYFLPKVYYRGVVDIKLFCAPARISTTSPDVSLYRTGYKCEASGMSRSRPIWGLVRYLQASPPYDLGYGEIPLFIFLQVNNQGEILNVSTSQDPPWAESPDAQKDFYRDGRHYRRRLKNNQPQLRNAKTSAEMRACLNTIRNPDCWEEVEVNQNLKNANMNTIPHPFLNLDAGDRVLLLDTLSPTGQELAELIQQGELDALQMFSSRYLRIDSQPLDVTSPQGVLTVRAHWKNSSMHRSDNQAG